MPVMARITTPLAGCSELVGNVGRVPKWVDPVVRPVTNSWAITERRLHRPSEVAVAPEMTSTVALLSGPSLRSVPDSDRSQSSMF